MRLEERLARLACDIEICRCQEPIGKQDQYAAAYGGLNLIRFHSDDSVSVDPVICEPAVLTDLEASTLVFYTGRARKASAVLTEQCENMSANRPLMRRMVRLAFNLKEARIGSARAWDRSSMKTGASNDRWPAVCRTRRSMVVRSRPRKRRARRQAARRWQRRLPDVLRAPELHVRISRTLPDLKPVKFRFDRTAHRSFSTSLRIQRELCIHGCQLPRRTAPTVREARRRRVRSGCGGREGCVRVGQADHHVRQRGQRTPHSITDWNKMVNLATGRKLRGISLCDNVGIVTAFANDIAYEEVFAGQLKAILEPNDLLIALSGSGHSANVVKAVEYASGAGATTLAVVGYDGGHSKRIARHVVWVPSFDMQLCEDVHLMFGHMVMKTLCGSGSPTEPWRRVRKDPPYNASIGGTTCLHP